MFGNKIALRSILKVHSHLPWTFNPSNCTKWVDDSMFFETPEVVIIGIFCLASNGSKVEIVVASQINLNTNLDFSTAYRIKTNATGD